ncbi:CBO0543 family protein [Paenibacillus sp.]|uniref:CBO0543 family protein n=1 Tax=Paenibacillus sp. TaxID=58172 RepID=UPI0028111A6F|nr:CBO0543 family protein [Paenibacillus sp.]
MILLSNAALLTAALVTGAGKRWRQYYDTILFVSLSNLLYNFLCHNRLTWTFQPESLLSHKVADLINTFVLLPCTAILYLHHFPSAATTAKKSAYYAVWVGAFSAMEWVWQWKGVIVYDHEWTYYWSVGFYVVMFAILRLHHTRPERALLYSAIVVLFLIGRFQVPLVP